MKNGNIKSSQLPVFENEICATWHIQTMAGMEYEIIYNKNEKTIQGSYILDSEAWDTEPVDDTFAYSLAKENELYLTKPDIKLLV